MKFSQDFIQQVKEANDIVDVASDYYKLEKRGDIYQTRCKHGDRKSASLTFFPSTQSYYCFGCHAGSRESGGSSDVISFVQWMEEVSWPEAVVILAQRANIFIPQDSYTAEEKAKMKLYNEIIGRNRQYWKNLQEDKEALTYLEGRQIKKDDIDRWRIGYSNGNDRVAFAIMDEYSKTVGFGYRTLKGEEPKYFNSRDSEIFKKGNNLYGLNFVKRRIVERGYVVVVEGYTDVIQLQKYGVPAVGVMGTALTKEQITLIKKYTDTIVLFFDNDEAGVSTTLKYIKSLTDEGLMVKVFTYSGDPDEFAITNGPKTLPIIEEEAVMASVYQLGQVLSDYISKEADLKLKILRLFKKKVLPLARTEEELEICMDRLKEVLHLPEIKEE